jgi:hypothetical protein
MNGAPLSDAPHSDAPHLYQRRVSPDALANVVDALEREVEYLYLESETTIDLVRYPHALDSTWTHGRAFGPRLEVRWQKAGDEFDLLLLTEAELETLDGWQAVERDGPVVPFPDSADPPGQVMLWGTHVSHLQQPHRLAGGKTNAWIETRIPRALEYPIPGTPRWVKARVIVYRLRGQPVLTRLAGLEGEQDEPQ